MQKLINLIADLCVELNNHAVNHRLVDQRSAIIALQQLGDKSRHPLPGNVVTLLARCQAGLRHDLIEESPVSLSLSGLSLRLCHIAHLVSLLWQCRWMDALTLERQGRLSPCASSSSSSANS